MNNQNTMHHPLETFLCEYLDAADGVWDQVEPQVYDLMPPASAASSELDPEAPEQDESVLRVTFDPEARADHPQSELLTLGTPLMDRLLLDARNRGAYAQAYLLGLNLHPYDLSKQLQRAFELPGPWQLTLAQSEPVQVTTAVCWFAATYVGDQKEQDLLPVGIERYHGRAVRHLDELLASEHLSDTPAEPLDEANHLPALKAYALARRQVVRTISGTANQRRRALTGRIERQQQRMRQYYEDLLDEIDEQEKRAQNREDPKAQQRAVRRRQQVQRERDLRLNELTRKTALRVQLRLAHLLEIHQPKVRCHTHLCSANHDPIAIELLWDPLTGTFEPPTCPGCHQPTTHLQPAPLSRTWHCSECPDPASAGRTRR